MEKKIEIKTKDGHFIHGTFNKGSGNSKKLIIFVHGLGGHQNEHQFFNASRFFTKKGFDTYRFDQYGYEGKARPFRETSLSVQAEDLNNVIGYWGSRYKLLYLIGHSLGGPTILLSEWNKACAVVLWDPSVEPKNIFKEKDFKKIGGLLVAQWEVDIVIGDKMIEDANNLPPISQLLKAANVPIKIIGAGNAGAKHSKDLYFKNANEPKAFFEIKGSGHGFSESGMEDVLFQETFEWIKKY